MHIYIYMLIAFLIDFPFAQTDVIAELQLNWLNAYAYYGDWPNANPILYI